MPLQACAGEKEHTHFIHELQIFSTLRFRRVVEVVLSNERPFTLHIKSPLTSEMDAPLDSAKMASETGNQVPKVNLMEQFIQQGELAFNPELPAQDRVDHEGAFNRLLAR